MEYTLGDSEKRINAEVHFVSVPCDAPAGVLTRCLFGVSMQSLAMEIADNRSGEWDSVYCHEGST